VSESAPDDRSRAHAPESDAAATESAAVREAVRSVRRGNRGAFGLLVARYQRRLFGLTLMVVRDPSAAEELAQDAFVRAFTRLDRYDEQRPFYPWLATIAVRLSQNWLRLHARTAGRAGSALDPNLDEAVSVDPLAELVADERSRHLWRLVARLPSGQRTAVVLHYRQDMKVADVARALGVTSGTVKTLLFRARRRLREAMTAAEGSADPENQT
jgi:RNA polymerase sigma-70 factor (ECF subfamily)